MKTDLLIIDGLNLLFRMFFGIPAPIRNSDGKDIRGIIGFTGSLIKIIEEFEPYKTIVIFDTETSLDDNENDYYKANRIKDWNQVEDDQNPFTQLNEIIKVLEFLKIEYRYAELCEADQYIANICYENTVINKVIVSTDKDYWQLINNNTSVFYPRGKKSVLYDEEKVYEKIGVLPINVPEYKALVGDSSDGIPGIKGIGPKTAVEIINEFKSIDNIKSEIGKSENKKVYDKLSNELEQLEEYYKLVKLDYNEKLNTSIEIAKDEKLKYKTMEILEILKIR